MTEDEELPWAEFVLGAAKRTARKLSQSISPNDRPATCDMDDVAQDMALHVLDREDYYRDKRAEQGHWGALALALKRKGSDAIHKAQTTPMGLTGRGARSQRRYRGDAAEFVDQFGADAHHVRIQSDQTIAVRQWEDELPERQLAIIQATYANALGGTARTQAQIAEELGISERTVRNDLRAAEAALKERLEPLD